MNLLPNGTIRRIYRPARRFAVLVLAAVAGLVLVAVLDRANPVSVTGRARLADGDSLEIGNTRVRLVGIDAPELDQTCERSGQDWDCGRAARETLSALIGGTPIACTGTENDQYGRLLAVCRVGGTELNAAMVEAGLALDGGGYGAQERRARDARKGLWAGSFLTPRQWRDGLR
jgi:endonuclease YncB( thermonuclease family)